MIEIPVSKLDRLRPHVLDKLYLFKTVKETKVWHEMSLVFRYEFEDPKEEMLFNLIFGEYL